MVTTAYSQLSAFPIGNRFEDLHSIVAKHAWQLWMRYGRPKGREIEIWMEAEREITDAVESETGPANAKPDARSRNERCR